MRRLLLSICATLLVPGSVSARTWHVPSEVEAIPDAVDSASYGDTVLVAPGTYICPDNTDYSIEWVVLPSGVSLVSSAGPEYTTIIDQTATSEPHRVLSISDGQDCVVKGFSFVRQSPWEGLYFYGMVTDDASDCFIDSCSFTGFGFGMKLRGQAAHWETPQVRWCSFTDCGIGIECRIEPFYSPLVRFCRFDRCSWGIRCIDSAPYLCDNYIANSSWSGMWFLGGSPALLDRNVIVNNGQYGVYVDTDPGGEPGMTTQWLPHNGNSIYGNAEYDLYSAVEDQSGVVEARFTYWGSDCPDFEQVIGGPGRVNYLPWSDSTHTEEYVECPPQATKPSTWGAIKSIYR